MPPAIAATVTTLPADRAAEPAVAAPGDAVLGAMVSPRAVGVAVPRSRSLEPAVGAMLSRSLEPAAGAELMPASSTEVGAEVGTPVPKSRSLEPAVGVAVCDVGVGAMVTVSPGARGAIVVEATVGTTAGEGVNVPSTITQGAVSTQAMLAARMVAEQQSSAPLVPAMSPQPTPPQTPLHSSAQQTDPEETPGSPLAQVEAVTSEVKEK